MDPFVLSGILKGTGPIEVDGQIINDENVAQLILYDLYISYEKNNQDRKQFLVRVIQSTMQKAFEDGSIKLQQLWPLRSSILENRIKIYSVDKQIQEKLSKSDVSGSLRKSPSGEFRLVIQNTAGNKMDFFIKRSIFITRKTCGVDGITQLNFKVKNVSDPNLYLPDNYYGRQDLASPANPNNSTSLTLMLYGPPRARFVAAADVETGLSAGYLKSERSRQILVIPLQLQAQESREFIADFSNVKGDLSSFVQPLAKPQVTKITDGCSR
jgi:hypothetical protein